MVISTNIMEKKDLLASSDDQRGSRGLVSIARGWVYIHGLVLSSYCYLFLFIMAFLFLLGGGLLTAISFRPQEIRETLGEWSYPIAKSKNTRIAGPGLILLGILMAVISLVLCQASRRLYATRLNMLPCVLQSSHITTNPGFAKCENSDEQKRRTQDVSVFSVVQNRDESFFTDGCSGKNELLVAYDIACFPAGATPRSLTPITVSSTDWTPVIPPSSDWAAKNPPVVTCSSDWTPPQNQQSSINWASSTPPHPHHWASVPEVTTSTDWTPVDTLTSPDWPLTSSSPPNRSADDFSSSPPQQPVTLPEFVSSPPDWSSSLPAKSVDLSSSPSAAITAVATPDWTLDKADNDVASKDSDNNEVWTDENNADTVPLNNHHS